MLPALGERIARAFRATAPDPFVLAILLTVLTFALAVGLTGTPARDVLQAWAEGAPGTPGVWGLLEFAMQMCLILVTGHALAASPPVARLLRRASALPRTGPQGAAMIAFLSIAFGLINWGLGLIVGAVLARDVGRAMRAKGVAAPYALLVAAGYTGMMTWHGGLSGSAPLAAASSETLGRLVGPEVAAAVGGRIPLEQTTFSSLNLVATGGLLILVPAFFALLCPKGDRTLPPAGPIGPETQRPGAPPPDEDRPGPVPRFLENSPIVVWLIAAPALLWLAPTFWREGLGALDLNTANLSFLAAGLILHGSAARYGSAVEEGVRGCGGIILQFPLYAGIIGIMRSTGLVRALSDGFVSAAGGNESALSGLMFLSAGLVNLFVPSGGGQWAVQGPIALQAALDAGASPGKLVMAVAYGDQLTNMIQPFWALPLLGLTGARARDIVGYTAMAMVVGGAWIALCLAIL